MLHLQYSFGLVLVSSALCCCVCNVSHPTTFEICWIVSYPSASKVLGYTCNIVLVQFKCRQAMQSLAIRKCFQKILKVAVHRNTVEKTTGKNLKLLLHTPRIALSVRLSHFLPHLTRTHTHLMCSCAPGARRTKSRGLQGLQLEIGLRRAPRFLLLKIQTIFPLLDNWGGWLYITRCKC